MSYNKKLFGQKIIDCVAPNLYNSLPLIVKKNIICNQLNVKKLANKC